MSFAYNEMFTFLIKVRFLGIFSTLIEAIAIMWSNQTNAKQNVSKAKFTDWFMQPLKPFKP